MTMTRDQISGIKLVEKWIRQNRDLGKTDQQMAGMSFVYGNEMLTLFINADDRLQIKCEQRNVVVFRQIEELNHPNICRACGSDYLSDRDAIECCANVD